MIGFNVAAVSLVTMLVSWFGLAMAVWSINLSRRARRAYVALTEDLAHEGRLAVVCPYVTYNDGDLAHCVLRER